MQGSPRLTDENCIRRCGLVSTAPPTRDAYRAAHQNVERWRFPRPELPLGLRAWTGSQSRRAAWTRGERPLAGRT
jgi:hypothetical protein